MGELLARISADRVQRAELARLADDHVPVLAGLAEVNGEADDLGAVTRLDPVQHDGGVQAAGVQQQHPPDPLWVRLVARDPGCLGHRGREVSHGRFRDRLPDPAHTR